MKHKSIEELREEAEALKESLWYYMVLYGIIWIKPGTTTTAFASFMPADYEEAVSQLSVPRAQMEMH